MLAKVIVSSLNWEDVIKRGERALKDMGLFGIKTTIPYYLEILKHPDFRAASFNTGFVEKYPELVNYSNKPRPEVLASVIAAVIAAHTGL
jgi:pyruvate carboxylase subunit A